MSEETSEPAERDAVGSGHPQFIKLSPIATTAAPNVHSRRAPSQLNLKPRRSKPHAAQQASGSRIRDSGDVGGKVPALSRGSRSNPSSLQSQLALESFGRAGHLVERADMEVHQVETPEQLQERAGRDASSHACPATPAAPPNPIPPSTGGSQARKAPAEPPPLISAAAVAMHARAACFISQRMQTSCSVSQFRQLKALLLYSFLQANTDGLAACRRVSSLLFLFWYLEQLAPVLPGQGLFCISIFFTFFAHLR